MSKTITLPNTKTIIAIASIIIIVAGAFGAINQTNVNNSLGQLNNLQQQIDQLNAQLNQPVGSTLSAMRKGYSFQVSFATNGGVPDTTLCLQSGVNGSVYMAAFSATNYTWVAVQAINNASAINGSIYFAEGNYSGMVMPTIPLTVAVTIDAGAFNYTLGTVLGTLTDYHGSIFYVAGNINQQPYSYMIFNSTIAGPSWYYAKNGTDSSIVTSWSSTNSSAVINHAVNALTNGRTWQETVMLKGNFALSYEVDIPAFTRLVVDGSVTALGWTDIIASMFQVLGDHTDIVGGVYNGSNIAGMLPIYVYNCNHITVSDTTTENCSTGIYFQEANNDLWIEDNIVQTTQLSGISGAGNASYLSENIHIIKNRIYDAGNEAGTHGIYVNYLKNSEIADNAIFNSDINGIKLDRSYSMTVSRNTINITRSSDGILCADSTLIAAYNSFVGNTVIAPKTQGMDISGNDSIINLNRVLNVPSGYWGIISQIGFRDIITGNVITGNGGLQLYKMNYSSIANNDLTGTTTALDLTYMAASIGTQWSNNIGFVTANSGSFSNLADGATLAHGLAGTPTSVIVTSGNSTATIVGYYAADSVDFELSLKNAVTGLAVSGQSGSWVAYYNP